MEKTMMRTLANFLKIYVRFSKPETYHIFETEMLTITSNTMALGIEELILQRAKQEGKAEDKAEVLRKLIIKMGLNNEQAAEIAGVGVKFVQQLREELAERKA